MKKKDAIGRGQDSHTGKIIQLGQHAFPMGFIADIERDVSHHPVRCSRRQVDGTQVRTFLRERGRHLRKHARFIVEFKPYGQPVV
jgi:hypothetical protein